MNITLISLVFPPEPGSARRVGELADFLAKQGHQVSVITGFPSYPTGILYPGYKKKLIYREIWHDRVNVFRMYLYTSPKRDVFIHRLFHYLTFTLTCLLGGFVSPRPDIVYVVSPPYFLGLSGWIIARLRKGKLVFDVQDFWPEAPITLGYVKNRALITFLLKMEEFIYRHADLIFALSPRMRDKIIQRKANPEKVVHVYNWVDLKVFETYQQKTEVLAQFKNHFVVLFAGNMGVAQVLDTVLDAAVLLQTHPHIVFILLGGGMERARLEARAKQLGLSNVVFMGPVTEAEVLDYFAEADVLLVTLGKAPHREAALPSKIQMYMATGKPILAAVAGAAAEVIEAAQCGIVVESESPEALAAGVLKLSAMSDETLKTLGTAGASYARQHFALENQCGYIESQLSHLLEPHGD